MGRGRTRKPRRERLPSRQCLLSFPTMKVADSLNLKDRMELKVDIVTSLCAAMMSIAQEIRGTLRGLRSGAAA